MSKEKNLTKELVSIVMPVHNAARFLDEAIQSVINQSYKDWELLLIDDCSSDDSKKIYKKYSKDKRICWVTQNTNLGPALTRNHGVELASGRYLCFLDSDDKWDYTKLEKQINFMKENKCAFSYHSYEFANEKCQPLGKKVFAINRMTYRKALKNTIIFTSTVMADTGLLNKELLKMPNLKYVEDTATWWRIMRSGYDAYGMAEILALYRRSPNTESSNKLRTQKPLWSLYRNEEKLNVFYSAYCMFWKNFHALLRRVV